MLNWPKYFKFFLLFVSIVSFRQRIILADFSLAKSMPLLELQVLPGLALYLLPYKLKAVYLWI